MSHNIYFDLGKQSYQLGINQFTDWTHEEFSGLNKLKSNSSAKSSTFLAPLNVKYPNEVDWRKEGLVTEVKDQGQCGSCWAFSATGSLEGQHKKKTGKLVSLSEQNLIDCSRRNDGCGGGLYTLAFEYVKNNKGIDTELSYPYLAQQGKCHFNRTNVGATATGYVTVEENDELALMQAVATVGPISVAIDASHDDFQHYKSGVFDSEDCSSTDLDHGVLVVGYGTENGKDYWLVKNSWGKQWGEAGYIKIARNHNNVCGVATQASYPLV